MAGGIYSSMNKIRPGAYINFRTNQDEDTTIGTAGIVTMPLLLSWGPVGQLIEVTGTDMLNGNSLKKIGLMNTDSDAGPINLALENCRSVKIYNYRAAGDAATKTLTGGLVITAKYPGTFGNKIAILIKAITDGYIVETYADGYFVDSQKVAAATDLVANDYVTFGGTSVTLAATESTLLTGGSDGAAQATSTYFSLYFALLKNSRWNVLAYTGTVENDKQSIITFINTMRNDEGKYVQAVMGNITTANNEGIINSVCGVYRDNASITAENFVPWVAGATAGAGMTESLTGKVVEGATSIVGLLDNDATATALQAGKFILSFNQNGTVKVEKDINSLHTFTAIKGYDFSKNRVIRELDGIGTGIEDIWETTYLGKVSNNEAGRTLFRSSLINYLTGLENDGAIEDFDPDSVVVEPGDDVDSVIASIVIKPVDSMEFLYLTINV